MNPSSLSANADARENGTASCATSMTFNFAVGAIALLAAAIICYAVYAYFSKG
jgi:hypothetical protein